MQRRSFVRFYAAPLLVMALAYILPIAATIAAVGAGQPHAVRVREELVGMVDSLWPIRTVSRQLRDGHTVRATLTVFLWNFGVGALIMSTLLGGVFCVLPPLVAVLRGMMLGFVYDPAVFDGARAVVVIGTGLLELPSYMIAGTLGIRLGLAWLYPQRRERLREVWDRSRGSIPAVGLLLLLAAIWEVGGLTLLAERP